LARLRPEPGIVSSLSHRRGQGAWTAAATTPPDERTAFWQFVRWRQNQAYNHDWLGDITDDDYERAGLWRLVRSFMFQLPDTARCAVAKRYHLFARELSRMLGPIRIRSPDVDCHFDGTPGWIGERIH